MYDWTVATDEGLDSWHGYKTGHLAQLEDGKVCFDDEVYSWHKWRTGQLIQLEEWTAGTACRLKKMAQRKD